MKGVFVDATDALGNVYREVHRPDDPPVTLHEEDVPEGGLFDRLDGYDFVIDDHSAMPTTVLRRCKRLRHVIFLGTGARSYMDPDELAASGIAVHTIRGYGDTAVAEHAIALMWAAARGVARMDRAIRAGAWLRTEGVELKGKTIGVVGFGGIGAEVARIAAGSGMRVLAWNRSAKSAANVTFVPLERLLSESDVVSLHLLLVDETRGLLGPSELARMRSGAILVNTARAALVDETAMLEALEGGRLGHAALDVFTTEPLPPDHPLTKLDNVTLSAHSGFRTPEASERLVRSGLDIARKLAAQA